MSAPTLHFTRAIKNIVQFALFLSYMFLLGCRYDLSDIYANDEPSSSAYSDTKIEGQAANSVIENGIVRSYEIAHSEEGSTPSTTPFGFPVRTDKNGSFIFSIPSDIEADSILIKITADERTKMTCDVIAGCSINNTEEKVAFGNTFLLDDNFEITAILPTLDHGFTNTVTINPLTHLASSLAKSQETGPTIENINASYRQVENLFGLSARALLLPTPDITKLDEQAEISQAAMKVAILSTSFLALTNSPDWESISEVIHHAANRISISGTIAAANMGALPEVSLDDLFYQAGETTLGLLTHTDSPEKQNTLNSISDEVKASYELVMITPEIISPPEIETHPISADISEGQPANFMVTAFGDDLSYQWQLNNTPISGANEAIYVIDQTSLENAGIYNVVVSNLTGAQVSLSALLNIIPTAQNNEELPTDTDNSQAPIDTNTDDSQAPIDTNTDDTQAPIENIPAPNMPPVAQDDTIEIFEDTPTTIFVLANDSDTDNDPLTITQATVTSGPGHISVRNIVTNEGLTSNALFFTPEQHSTLPSTISYTISDDHNNLTNAQVNLSIFPINDAPEAFPDTAETEEDTPITLDILANDYDADGDTLTISSASSASGFVVINSNNTITFQASSDFNGIAEINYIILDGHGGLTAGTAIITVISVNDPPVATNDTAETSEDTTVKINVLSNDYDKELDELKVTLASSAEGQVNINPDNTLTFTPNENFNGPATLNYTISDEMSHTASNDHHQSTAQVNISILPINDIPVSFPDTAEMQEDTSITLDVLANDYDADNDTLTISSASSALGTVKINPDNTITYQAIDDFTGVTEINYTAVDGHSGITANIATITVIGINDLPIAIDDTAETIEDTAVTIDVLTNDSDKDLDELIITHASSPDGQVSINAGNTLTFTPKANFNGSTTLNYTISDENGGTSSAKVIILVLSVNDSPALTNDTAETNEDTPVIINILANDSDADNDTLTASDAQLTSPGGRVSLNRDNTLTFVPANDFAGEVNLSYTVDDGHGGIASAEVTVMVNSINDLPILANHHTTTEQSVAITINALADAYDIDGDTLTVIASTASHGDITINENQSITYKPSPDFSGEDTISYTASDGNGGVSSAMITVLVSAVEQFYSIALNWERPTERDDSSFLDPSDIKGYVISHEVSSNQLDTTVFVSGASITHYTMSDLDPGIHYFAIATITKDGIQGYFSEKIAISAGP